MFQNLHSDCMIPEIASFCARTNESDWVCQVIGGPPHHVVPKHAPLLELPEHCGHSVGREKKNLFFENGDHPFSQNPTQDGISRNSPPPPLRGRSAVDNCPGPTPTPQPLQMSGWKEGVGCQLLFRRRSPYNRRISRGGRKARLRQAKSSQACWYWICSASGTLPARAAS